MTTERPALRPRPGSVRHFIGQRASDAASPSGIAFAEGARMDERTVRGEQQQGRVECKPEASQSSAGGREVSRSVRAQGRARGLPDGWPPLLTASEVAAILRTTRKAVYAMAERAQLPGVTRIGRRLLVRRDDLLSWLDERRAASPGGSRR